ARNRLRACPARHQARSPRRHGDCSPTAPTMSPRSRGGARLPGGARMPRGSRRCRHLIRSASPISKYASAMRVALCQMPVSSQPAVNLSRVQSALTSAKQQGSDLAVFPEATQVRFSADLRMVAEPLDGPFCTGLAEAARGSGVALAAGIFEQAQGGLGYNTTGALDAAGNLVAAYRKIHLFDALGQRESETIAPGSELVIAELAGLQVGFVTCYDVRFPELARELAVRGADLIVIPSGWASGLFKEEH